MICKRHGGGWEIIYQRNHALLAAEMLADWREERRPEPWFQLLNACSQHDHGWQENEGDALIDEHGHPVDFLHMPTQATLTLSARNLANAQAQCRWCAILVSRHAEYLYSSKDEPETQAYLEEVRSLRQERMVELGVTGDQVEEMYELLCWADTLSLLVCCPPSDFTRALKLEAQGQKFRFRQAGDGLWTLGPWPYSKPKLSLTYEARYLPQLTFASQQELKNALAGIPAVTKKLTIKSENA